MRFFFVCVCSRDSFISKTAQSLTLWAIFFDIFFQKFIALRIFFQFTTSETILEAKFNLPHEYQPYLVYLIES